MSCSQTSLGWGRDLGYSSCCPPVFDPAALIGLLGGIALATYFLREVIIVTEVNFSSMFKKELLK